MFVGRKSATITNNPSKRTIFQEDQRSNLTGGLKTLISKHENHHLIIVGVKSASSKHPPLPTFLHSEVSCMFKEGGIRGRRMEGGACSTIPNPQSIIIKTLTSTGGGGEGEEKQKGGEETRGVKTKGKKRRKRGIKERGSPPTGPRKNKLKEPL